MLVIEVNAKVFLALQSQGLLSTHFRASGEEQGGNGPGTTQGSGSRSEIRYFDIVNANVSDFDVFRLVLTAESSTIKSSAWLSPKYQQILIIGVGRT